jgi:hypothetical protein
LVTAVASLSALFLISKIFTGDLHFDRTLVIDEGINKGMLIGEARGVEKEKELVAQKMLEAGTDIKFISSVTGLSNDQIIKLRNKI